MEFWPRTDFHIHATRYRAQSPREEMSVAAIVHRCEELCLSEMGILEHLNPSPSHPLECMEALAEEFRATSSDVPLSLGVEVNIEDPDGTVTISPHVVDRLGLDFVIAGIHGLNAPLASIGDYIEYYHRALMSMVERVDFVDVVAHPWTTRQPLQRQGIPDECTFERITESYLMEFVEALSDRGKAFEINRKAQKDFGDPAYRTFIAHLRDAGVAVSVASDAHQMDAIGTTFITDDFLREMGFPAQQVWTPKRRT